MEFLAGGSLDALIADSIESKKFPLADDLIWRLARGIAAGMASLASQNIIHRDLAARNVLLDTNQDPRIADFGFSRVVDSGEQQGKTNSTGTFFEMLDHSRKHF
jgi:serine/threonine protein kinase